MTPNEFPALLAGYQRSRILLTAMELGIFNALAAGPESSGRLATSLGTHPRSTERLLDALTGIGVLSKTEGSYALAEGVRAFLTPGSELYQGDMIRHHLHLWESWSRLTEAVRTGQSQAVRPSPGSPEAEEGLRDFICAMSNTARLSVQSLMEVIDFSKDKHLLDVGGGPGTYSLAIAAAHPQLRATVFDYPEVLRITREQITQAHLEDRVGVCPGDALADEYGHGYDTVLMSNLIHAFGPEEIRSAFARAFRALIPGGRILVKEFVVDPSRTQPDFAALFSINMLVNTEQGDVYTEGEIKQWLEEAGFRDVRRTHVAMFSAVLSAIRP